MKRIQIEQNRNFEGKGEKRIKHWGEVGLQRRQISECGYDYTAVICIYICIFIDLTMFFVITIDERALKQ